MLSRASLRSSRSALASVHAAQRRTYAAASTSQFNYNTADAAGTRLVSRDVPGPTSTLALVSKAGTRYEWVSGLSEGLKNYAFKNTEKRFAVRIIRETELLGSEIFTDSTREAVVFGAKFFREDLPYFVELLAEIASETRYSQYVIDEVIKPSIHLAHEKFLANPAAVALNAAHAVAFHRGLGNSIYPAGLASTPKLNGEEVAAYAAAAYAKSNIALVGSGIDQSELSKWSGEFFKDVPVSAPAGLPSLDAQPSKYYGGEQRIDSGKGNSIVLAFEGTGLATGQAYKPEVEVLASLLGGPSPIKWGQGNSILAKAVAPHKGVNAITQVSKYSDSGLLHVTLTGPSKALAAAAKDVSAAVKSIASGSIPAEELKKAISQAKFASFDAETAAAPRFDLIGLNAITSGKVQTADESLKGIASVSENAVSQAAKKLLDGKATVVAVGNLSELPYAEELGINV